MTSNGPTSPDGLGDRLIAFFWRRPAATLGERTRRRVALHLIPYLFFLYVLAYLDRVNVSVAALRMGLPPEEGGLGFSREVIGFGAGIFFWGYWILEIPSTVSVVRWGARYVFVRILVLWGLCATLIGFVGLPLLASLFGWLPQVPEGGPGLLAGAAHFVNHLHDTPEYQFYFLRFLLGFFEGGFFPSVIVYLSHWFRPEDRAKAIASFMAAIPLSSMLGMPASGLLLGAHWFGLPGWRWIFILQGVAPVLAGVATLFFLPDSPRKAKWLSAEERDWLVAELEREHQAKQGHGHWAWVHHLGMVLLLTAVYFCLNFTSYGLSMFMPAIIKSQSGASDLVASLLAALPYLMGLVGMLVNGWHSDRTGERFWHVAVPLAMLGVGLWLAVACDGVPVLPVLVMILVVGTFHYAHLPAFWPIPTMFLGATAAASAIGFINMVGNLGGSVGPMVVGKESTGLTSFAPALRWLAPWPLVAAAIVLVVGYARRKRLAAAAATAGASGAAPDVAIQADLRSITTEPGE
jgi:ACS family tartrate transporter-like MFS transporter